MRSLQSNIFISLILWLLIALCAWPFFVAANALVGSFTGEANVLDNLQHEPKRKVLQEFLLGYKLSAGVAALVGLVAVVDFQLLSKHSLTGYIAGILIPIVCIALAFVYYPNPASVLPGFAIAGLGLWVVYKFVDIGSRLRRVNQ